jgi:hypothetical protein
MSFASPPDPYPSRHPFYTEARLLTLCRQPRSDEARLLIEELTDWLTWLEREQRAAQAPDHRRNRRREIGLDKLRRAMGAIAGEVLWHWAPPASRPGQSGAASRQCGSHYRLRCPTSTRTSLRMFVAHEQRRQTRSNA